MSWLGCVVVTLSIVFIVNVQGISWRMDPNGLRCLKEEVQGDVLVVGEYEVSEAPGQRIDFVVKDSKNHILYQKEDIPHGKSWKFTFITETYNTFECCFKSHVPSHIRGNKQDVTLNVKHGIEAKSYEGIGEAAKLKPIEVEIKRLEDLSEVIVKDFERMRENEKQMRDTNEQTTTRVFYFSILSMLCLLGLATWQSLYLRRFFKSKKLIE